MNKKILVLLAVFAGSLMASSALDSTTKAMGELCVGLIGILPVAAMLMIVIAGVIYASGQMMGAETRARANVWATAALTGALMAILIVAIAPSVFETIYPTADGITQGICTTASNL